MRAALEELALVQRRIDHIEALEHIATKLPRQSARDVLNNGKRKHFLPPGCRMTATHFEFT